MIHLLTVIAATQLLAAPPAEISVIIARQEGVSKKQALDVAGTLIKVLQKNGLSVEKTPIDGLACLAKKPCIVALGRKQHSDSVVMVEVASILDDAVVRAEALSVGQDGKRVALAEYEGALGKKADLEAALLKLVKPLKDASSTSDEPKPEEPAKPVAVTKPVEPPKPVEVVKPAEVVTVPVVVVEPAKPAPAPAPVTETKGLSSGAVVGAVLLGVGGVVGLSSIYFGVQTLNGNAAVTALCPNRAACDKPQAVELRESAIASQTTGFVLLGVGTAVAATGLILLLTQKAEPESPKVSLQVGPSGAAATLSGRW